MRKALTLLLFILLLPAAVYAQVNAPDYQVAVTNREVSADSTTLVLQFSIYNLGGAATVESSADLYIETDGERLLESQPLRALGSSPDLATLTFDVPLDSIPGGNVDFRLEVGIGSVEPANSPNIGNNTARVGYLVPTPSSPRPTRAPATTAPTTPAQTTAVPQATPFAPTTTPSPSTIRIEGLPFTIDLAALDFANPLTIAGIIALLGVGLILLWVLTVILRLLFRPPRMFEVWQPPYAAVPPHDPNTLAGRRQLWQHNAQSDTMNAPTIDGQYHIRKLLVGVDGKPLSGWRVRGLRLSQYDIYGRVARSQTLASNSAIRRLDKEARRSATLKEADADKWVRPIARQLTSAFLKNVNRRSLMLPIAVDLRFRGTHGEVRIIFELYQYRGANFAQIDRWEPEMTVVSGAIQENFTYTLLGLRQGENFKAFRTRLQEELHKTLKSMLYKPLPTVPTPITGDTAPSEPILPVPPQDAAATSLSVPRGDVQPTTASQPTKLEE
jgi:cell division septation protein DedD